MHDRWSVGYKARTPLVTSSSEPLRKRIGSLLLRAPRSPRWRERVVVLRYHSVHPSMSFPSSTPPELFERHMRWLREECDVIPFARAWEERRRAARSRPAVEAGRWPRDGATLDLTPYGEMMVPLVSKLAA
jgi:hypothetical protein